MAQRYFGRIKDKPDPRDHHFRNAQRHLMTAPIPPAINFASDVMPAIDQGDLGSCEPNAANRFLRARPFYPGSDISRLDLYYKVRSLEGDVGEDTGCMTRDIFRVLTTTGVMPESEWPYDITQYTVKPPSSNNLLKLGSYSRLTTAAEVLACLANRQPIVMGFDVPKSFSSDAVAQTGVVPFPRIAEDNMPGHGVCICGYDLHFRQNPAFLASGVDPSLMTDHALIVLNSWGKWGYNGTGLFFLALPWAVDKTTGADLWSATK